MLPSEESATPAPNSARAPISSAPVSFEPCWVQVEPERVNTHAEPGPSSGPPTSAVLPSEDSATLTPKLLRLRPLAPVPVSFGPCWAQVEPERVNTHAAPVAPLSPGPPIRPVVPSGPPSATFAPNSPADPSLLTSSPPVSFDPCWLHVSDERVNTHAAPMPLLSPGPPISAVPAVGLGDESATLAPNLPGNVFAPGSS